MKYLLICAALTIVGVQLAPVKSYAQSDKVIVMSCHNQYPGETDLTIDLVAKTVVDHGIGADGGTQSNVYQLTQITDQQIVWTESYKGKGYEKTLNRYTGVLTLIPFGWAEAFNAPPVNCQKQQKQF